MKKYILISVAVLLALSCEKEGGRVNLYGLGCEYPVREVGSAAGLAVFEVLADNEWTATISEEDSWFRFADSPASRELVFSGDKSLGISYDADRGISREGVIRLSGGNIKLELTLKQEGLLPLTLEVVQKNVLVPPSGGDCSARIRTLLNPDSFSFEASQPWIRRIRIENNDLRFDVDANYLDTLRTAVIRISSEGLCAQVSVSQASEKTVWTKADVDDVKALLNQEGSIVVTGHLLLEGIVLNDDSEGNGAENRNVSSIIQDLSGSSSTLYIANADNTSAVRVDFNSPVSDKLSRFDRVAIDLYGTSLTRNEKPLHYIISNVQAESIISSTEGVSLEAAPKHISDLADADIYTLVRIEDVEIPIGKGPFLPLDTRQASIMNKYPMVMLDKNGDNIYMCVNTVCSWGRNGESMPLGSGSVTGVLVHEHCDSFEWDKAAQSKMQAQGLALDYITGIGNIGPYQIRPIHREDIRLSATREESFSQILCEYTRFVSNSDSTAVLPTNSDNGRLYIKRGTSGWKISPKRDWTRLDTYNYGMWNKADDQAWSSTSWAATMYWCVEFSTVGIDSSHSPMSVQFGAVNGYGMRVGAPRYWKLEYSVDDSDFVTAGTYTVPDFALNSSRRNWQIAGPKYISITLPEDAQVWDKAKVSVRLKPASMAAGKGDTYDEGKIDDKEEGASKCDNALNYFSVRYNK